MDKMINETILIQLPIWVQQRTKELSRARDGRCAELRIVFSPFEDDIDRTDVELCAASLRELKSKLSAYQTRYLRK